MLPIITLLEFQFLSTKLIASKYKFDAGRLNHIVIRGVEKGEATVGVIYDKGAMRNDSPIKVIVTKARKPLTFKTNFGDAKVTIVATMQARKYEVGNPDTGKPDLIWDVRNTRVWAEKLELPTGYTMVSQPVMKRLNEMWRSGNTYFYYEFVLTTEVGPMFGSWTKYKNVISFDPYRGKVQIT